ncbi:MAG: glutathione S-transferase family protein [Burkholderiaceae bacterium]
MLQLIIGNKNYSSWSLRAWLLLTEAGIPFEETRLSLFAPSFHAAIGRHTPAGRVPVLIDPAEGPDGLQIWDTLAIAEYVAERFPDRHLWPAARTERARARSLCAEMHAGFQRLRQAMPMNIVARLPGCGWSIGVQDDIDRLVAMWRESLQRSGGPLLFGKFTIADAFFAPVVSRLSTYAVALPDDIAAYRDRILALDGMRAWTAAAIAEDEFLVQDEPYRRPD